MKTKSYLSVATLIFSVVAIAHFLRAIQASPLTIGSFSVPVWASWVGALVAAYLAYQGWKLRS
ncbi:MAG TPA: hypothetical protein VL306_02485 [Methylomirabilota bacterium]|nr:hypothetical protein [Methylomirabilota bacterium]